MTARSEFPAPTSRPCRPSSAAASRPTRSSKAFFRTGGSVGEERKAQLEILEVKISRGDHGLDAERLERVQELLQPQSHFQAKKADLEAPDDVRQGARAHDDQRSAALTHMNPSREP